MKTKNLFVLSGLLFGLAACGGGDDNNTPVAYDPNNPYNIPFSNVNGVGGFQNLETELVRHLQTSYGNIILPQSAVIGQTTLNANTQYTWAQFTEILNREAQRCLQLNYCRSFQGQQAYAGAGYSHQLGSPLSRVNLYQFREFLKFDRILSFREVRYQAYQNYNSYNLAHTADQVLSVFGNTTSGWVSYHGMGNGYWGYTPWYSTNQVGVYGGSPWYGNNNLYLGVNYNQGYGGLSIGGFINWGRR